MTEVVSSSMNSSRIPLHEARVAPEPRRPTEVSPDTRAPASQAETGDAGRTAALVEKVNQRLGQIEGNYSVSVDQDTGMVVVRITDAETGEIVRQIPPQQFLDANVSLEKIIGLLINDQA
jgi:flagellar protein FlaG